MSSFFESFFTRPDRFKVEKKEIEKPFHFEILDDPEVRETLIERMDVFIEAVRERGVDVLVFLDKSARPLAWLYRDRFRNLYGDEKIPEVKFLNVGSFERVKDIFDGDIDVYIHQGIHERSMSGEKMGDLVRESAFRDQWFGLQDLPRDFVEGVSLPDGIVEQTKAELSPWLQGKNVLVVDELGFMGRGTGTALILLSKAVPGARQYQAMALFSQEIHDSEDCTPWMGKEGIASVLEVSDEESFTRPLSKEAIEELKANLEKKKNEQAIWWLGLVRKYYPEILKRVGNREHDFALAEEVFALLDSGKISNDPMVSTIKTIWGNSGRQTQRWYLNRLSSFEQMRKDSLQLRREMQQLAKIGSGHELKRTPA